MTATGSGLLIQSQDAYECMWEVQLAGLGIANARSDRLRSQLAEVRSLAATRSLQC